MKIDQISLRWVDSCGVNHDYGFRQLVENALRSISRIGQPHDRYRWVIVCEMFCIGSQGAIALCKEFGLDPDELIK